MGWRPKFELLAAIQQPGIVLSDCNSRSEDMETDISLVLTHQSERKLDGWAETLSWKPRWRVAEEHTWHLLFTQLHIHTGTPIHAHRQEHVHTSHVYRKLITLLIYNKQNTKPKRRDACFHVGPHFRSSKIAFQDTLYLKSHYTPHSLLLHNRIWKTRFKT